MPWEQGAYLNPQQVAQYPAYSKLLVSVCWLRKWAKKPASFAYGEPSKIVIYGWWTKQCLELSLKRTGCRILTCMISFFHFKKNYEIEHRKRKVHKTYVDDLINTDKANTLVTTSGVKKQNIITTAKAPCASSSRAESLLFSLIISLLFFIVLQPMYLKPKKYGCVLPVFEWMEVHRCILLRFHSFAQCDVWENLPCFHSCSLVILLLRCMNHTLFIHPLVNGRLDFVPVFGSPPGFSSQLWALTSGWHLLKPSWPPGHSCSMENTLSFCQQLRGFHKALPPSTPRQSWCSGYQWLSWDLIPGAVLLAQIPHSFDSSFTIFSCF